MNTEYKKNLDMSVGEILKSIKEVINNRDPQANDDILELTDIIEHKKNLAAIKQPNQNLSNKIDPNAQQLLQETSVTGKTATDTTNILKNYSPIEIVDKGAEHTAGKGKILEELIVEMLRPALTKWLDTNLPCLVKPLVEKELQRLMPNRQK